MAYVQVQTVGVYNVELKRPDQEYSSDSWVLIYVEYKFPVHWLSWPVKLAVSQSNFWNLFSALKWL